MCEAKFTRTRITTLVAMTAVLAAAPVALTRSAGHLSIGLAQALAKGGDSSGHGSSGDSGGNSGGDRGGHGSDDAGGDHHGGQDSDDNSTSDDASDGRVARVEISGAHVEVVFADGTREEIDNGRYEMKDAAGRTVQERAATQADIDRLMALR